MDSSRGSKASEPTLPPVAGVKRPAPTLLPPFEPLSSSPALPRLIKKARGNAAAANNAQHAYSKYPTPVPTSSTGIMSSSPPAARVGARPALLRTQSAVSSSERTPLCAVPSIELNENGETLSMGRSSNSSRYQLSANRLISRVHVKARYLPATDVLEPNRIEIVCCGWNGLTLHCQGRTWDLSKGDTFTSETEHSEIMLDVQDARVRIQWPKKDRADLLATLSDSSWDSPRSNHAGGRTNNHGSAPGAPGASALQTSPLRRTARIASPVSPTPAGVPASGASLQALLLSQNMAGDEEEDDEDSGAGIQIYEDGSADELELPNQALAGGNAGASFATDVIDSFSSELSDLHSEDDDDRDDDSQHSLDNPDDDPDEENDPIVHSFGPFGANLSNRMALFTTNSPKIERPRLSRIPSADGSVTSHDSRTAPAAATATSRADVQDSARTPRPRTPKGDDEKYEKPEHDTADGKGADGDHATEGVGLGITVATAQPVEISSNVDVDTVRNHLINQLAFSRLSSSPLSTIMNNLPTEERRDLTRDALRFIIEGTACVGVIRRQGKDAAGQPLESEYYYVSDLDLDVSRRAVVEGLRKPSLRNCRKQHKDADAMAATTTQNKRSFVG
ncbi:transcription factor [Niveomyces insectorum RCEF 264]|uniref:Transcription factor n=1 Tax=Niveomyces insectorum RCEF 264 TaxID=1081102 RepID=A0A167YZ45_9HYPO|nr:transcription factor [Niveomyces insectorum RCEF 264]